MILPITAIARDNNVQAEESRGRFKKDSLFKVPVFAFRSNLLVAPLMNIGIEVPICNRISLEADFYSPWAKREWTDKFMPSHKGCVQIAGGTIGCRYWFGRQHRNNGGDARCRLLGHSLGLVAAGGIYDVERDWKGQQGEGVFVGVDYLYAHPVGKGGVHFEFNIGAGYGIKRYNNYNVRYEGGKLIDDGGRQRRHLPLPVRLGISLVVPICRKYNSNNNTEASEGLSK